MPRTPKTRALGAVLRQIREEKGLVMRDVTEAIHVDPGTLSRWETGDRTPTPEAVSQLLTWYGVTGARYHEIMTLAYRVDEPQWLASSLPEQRQQMAAYFAMEQRATQIIEANALLIPGVLQTPAYYRAMVATDDDVPEGEVESHVESRRNRCRVIERQNPAQLIAFIGQGAFNQDIGGRVVMYEQVKHLLSMTARPNVNIRIVPDGRGWHPGLEGLFTILEVAPGRNGSIAFVGYRRSALMLHEDEDINAYRRAVGRIARVALSAEASTNYIVALVKRWESGCDTSSYLAQVKP